MKEKTNSSAVEKRLQVIELATDLGNISEACRIHGMNRSSFYGWKRRYEQHGIEGLYNLPSTPKHNPRTTPKSVVDEIVHISLSNPSWGCIRISEKLKDKNIIISSPTVQKILIKSDIATIKDRWHKLEYLYVTEGYTLGQNQIERMEKLNPTFKERNYPVNSVGQLLSSDIFYMGTHKEIGSIYLCAVVDAYSSFAFASLVRSDNPEHIATLLHTQVFPFLSTQRIKTKKVLTSSSAKFISNNNPLKTYLRINEVEHIISKEKMPQTNGFVKKFKMISSEEFIKPNLKNNNYPSLEKLLDDFNTWISFYNYEKSNKGFPNFGQYPYKRLLNNVSKLDIKTS